MRGRLENLIGQTIFHKMEIVVVNSGSRENEERIVHEYVAAYPNILYTSTIQRETIYRAWNRGIAISRGKYITNANTDDILRNDALEVLASALDANPGVAMVYADQYNRHSPTLNLTSETGSCSNFYVFKWSPTDICTFWQAVSESIRLWAWKMKPIFPAGGPSHADGPRSALDRESSSCPPQLTGVRPLKSETWSYPNRKGQPVRMTISPG